MFRFKKNFLVLPLLLLLNGTPATAQELFAGEYIMLGRRCEDTGRMAPPTEEVQTMLFEQNGRWRHTYFMSQEALLPPSPLEDQQYWEEKQERALSRHLGYFEEDKARHEETCSIHEEGQVVDKEEGWDMCTSRGKRRLYEKWREERIQGAIREWEEDKESTRREYESLRAEIGEGCTMSINGSYQIRGQQLTLFANEFEADSACGIEDYHRPQQMRLNYYLDENFLYLVLPPDENSREYCGSSHWAEIYTR